MVKQIVGFFFLCVGLTVNSQDYSALWQGYFSYFSVKDLAIGHNKVYGASENAIFIYDQLTNHSETVTTINGLSGDTITVIAYSDAHDLLLIGYENGLIQLVSGPGHEVLSIVDILDKTTIPPNLKHINHFNVQDDLVYISTGFGISVYNLRTLEFGDSYYLGQGGRHLNVNKTAVLNQTLYAACSDNAAIKKAILSNPNLIDYREWQTLNDGNFISVETVGNQLYAVKSDGTIYEVVNDVLEVRLSYSEVPVATKSIQDKLIVISPDKIDVYTAALTSMATATPQFDTGITLGNAVISDEHLYIGTTGAGVLKTAMANPFVFENIEPNGPLRNHAFKIQAGNNAVWLSYGEYSQSYNPSPLRSYGLSYLADGFWNNIPYNSLLLANNLNYIAINPFNPQHVFVSSFHQGLLELNDGEATNLMTPINSALESLVLPSDPSYRSVRVSGSGFDRNGFLWVLNSRVDKALKSYDPSTGQWNSYSFGTIIPKALDDELGFGDLAIDRNGTKWIGSFYKGLIGYNEKGNRIRNINSLEQNMPSSVVTAVAVDNYDQLWIGTIKGLRVLYNTASFFESPNLGVREIVVMDDGIPQELLSNQYITDIKVDGSNNKWVGTLDAGLFCFSPDGQQTIYHFTRQNSPLPSDFVTDISIDHHNGQVYIATSNGLVSFFYGSSKTENELKSVFVYPNPVRPEYDILGAANFNDITKGVKIKGITENVNIKITDIEGNLVAEAQSRVNMRSSLAGYNLVIDGGTAIWNGKNFANNIVASGVYLIMISDLDSYDTKVLKLLIIR